MKLEDIQSALPPLLRGILYKEEPLRRYKITLLKKFNTRQNETLLCINDIHNQISKQKEIEISLLYKIISRDIHSHMKKNNISSCIIDIKSIGAYRVETSSDKDIHPTNLINGKIVFIVGAAKGIGYGLTERFVEKGAFVFIGDINYDSAKEKSKLLNQKKGYDCTYPIRIDVTSENSVKKSVKSIIDISGGIDVLISNVGIVKPGNIESYNLDDFIKLTTVNYTGYFLLVKHFVTMLRLQNYAHGQYYSDIIQINSKSGIEGSAKNSAYTGSKFAGIGLTRSFAHELIPDNIKVNAICPGNYYDGELWSDPQKGLFVQFLNVGRIPNAKTPQEVRKYYEDKSPIKRGVQIDDIMRAVVYAIEQTFETGQAIPVAGGQIMLH